MLVSVLLHILVLLDWPATAILLASVPGSDTDAAYERPNPIRLVRLPPPTRRADPNAVPQASAPHFTPRVPEVAVREMARRTALDLTLASPLPGESGIALSIAGGTTGSPGGELESAEDGYVEPIARDILLDWGPSEPLYGVVVTVRAHIDGSGKPTGPVELVPPTENQRVNGQIMSRVRTLEYRPGRRGGKPVAAWAEITFVFCGISVKAISPAAPTMPERPCKVVAVR